MVLGSSNRSSLEPKLSVAEVSQRSNDTSQVASLSAGWKAEPLVNGHSKADARLHLKENTASQQRPQVSEQLKHENAVSYSLPPGAQAARRVVERYSLDDDTQGLPSSGGSGDARALESSKSTPQDPITPSPSWRMTASTPQPSTPRGVGISGSRGPVAAMTSSPSYQNKLSNIPLSSVPRTSAQQPTYVMPPDIPNGMSPSFSPKPTIPQEEICVECAMRDQDMADVDVTSPGIWDRESDVLYEDLIRREQEDLAAGVVSLDHPQPQRPRAKGGRLTESNLKIWLSIVSTCIWIT
jgi:hypothetical protein